MASEQREPAAPGSNTATDDTQTLSTADRVYNAIRDLREMGRGATRKQLAAMTGLPITTIDDRIKHLRSLGRIAIMVNGVYEPTEDPAVERAVSGTFLPNGRFKVEIGDVVLDISMREARNLNGITAGVGQQFRG